MQPSRKTKLSCIAAGALLGGLLVGGLGFVQQLKTEHHYRELNTFFRGTVAGNEVLGISYLDYHGPGIMEGNQWKVQLRGPNARNILVYQNRPAF